MVLAHLGHRLVAQSLRLLRAEVWSSGADVRLGRVCARVAAVDEPVVVAHARLVITGADGHRLHEEVIQAGGRISRGRFARYAVGQLRDACAAATPDDAGPAVKAELVELWDTIAGPLFDAVEARGGSGPTVSSASSPTGQPATSTPSPPFSPISVPPFRRSSTSSKPTEQLTLDFDLDERDQFRRDVDALRRRLDDIPDEITREQRHPRRYANPVPRLFPAAVTSCPRRSRTEASEPRWPARRQRPRRLAHPCGAQRAIPHPPGAAQGVAQRTRPPRDGHSGRGTPPPCRPRPRRRRLGHHLDRMGAPRPA